MKPLLSITAVVFLLFYFTSCDYKKGDKNEDKYSYETVDGDPLQTHIYTLENGLKVYMSYNHIEPRIQTNIVVGTGSKHDPSDATGLAHYLEHMLFKGTSQIGTINWVEEEKLLSKISELYEKRRNEPDEKQRQKLYQQIDSLSNIAAQYAVPNEYDKLISSLGAKGTNAYTSLERTVYLNDIPSNELERWLIIESERFSKLVLRLFHTELETVYEEFNRGQDSDRRSAYYTMMRTLFKKHPYGTQTTIGSSEHLKNPSMEKIHEYFKNRYVPNNMAIILSGELNFDHTVDLIKKHFGHLRPTKLEKLEFEEEEVMKEPEIVEVYGNNSEWVDIAFRLPGINDSNLYKLTMLDHLLANGQAGLIDLNLVKGQKVLSGYSSHSVNRDYSWFKLKAKPREGQTLQDVRELLHGELKKVQHGEFDEKMLPAIVKNIRLQEERYNEYNWYRTSRMTNSFILHENWKDEVEKLGKLAQITKQDLIDFTNAYFSNNYVVVNKKQGDPDNIKVEKPPITQIKLNRDTSSFFASRIDSMTTTRIAPVFDDYDTQITRSRLNKNVPLYFVENTANNVFKLCYIFDMGYFNDKNLALSVEYLQYLGTDKYTADELQNKLYTLGLDFNVHVASERLYVTLGGINESLKEGIELFEHILHHVKPNQDVYDNMIQDKIKERSNRKLSKWHIFNKAMMNYGKYGPDSPTKYLISNDDLKAISTDSLVKQINQLTSYEHYVYYYGKTPIDSLTQILNNYHILPDKLNPLITPKEFVQLDQTDNRVYFVDYNMVQTELMMISKVQVFDEQLIAPARIFNEYFGSGLSSIVFQDVRESKALAYSAYSSFTTPKKVEDAHYVVAYIGSQVDKLKEAKNTIIELMNDMPMIPRQFEDAKIAALKKIETSRTRPSHIFWTYLSDKTLGIDYDLDEKIYNQIEKLDLRDLKVFFDGNVKGRNYTFLVIGDKNLINKELLKEMGTYQELTLEEIFGY